MIGIPNKNSLPNTTIPIFSNAHVIIPLDYSRSARSINRNLACRDSSNTALREDHQKMVEIFIR